MNLSHKVNGADQRLLFQLLTRIYCDSLSADTHFNAVAVFSQASVNEAPMLYSASGILLSGRADLLAISGFQGSGKADKIYVKNPDMLADTLLTDYAVPKHLLVKYPLSGKFPPSTDAEAFGLVEESQKRKWTSICITVPPLHQARAFISAVSAVIASGLKLKIYNIPAPALSWTEEVEHSQSSPKISRASHLGDEFQKIIRYREEKHHSRAEEILAYLDQRDK